MLTRQTRTSLWRRAGGAIEIALAGALLAGLAVGGQAEPTWWDNPTDIPDLAGQTGKGVVLYFESPKAEECIRMSRQTWPKVPSDVADQNFVWMRLNPESNSSFFTYYEVFRTPEIVFLDTDLKEVGRIQGFTEAEGLLARLRKMPKGRASIATTTGGQAVSIGDPRRAAEHRTQITNEGHYFFESFDGYKSISGIRSPLFQPIMQSSSRIDPAGGVYGSPCLIVDSGSQPSAAIRIDISSGLADVDQFEGRMLVRCKLRAIEVGQESTNVAAVSVVPAGEPATSPKGKRYYLTLSNAHAQWYDREVTTDAFNFKAHKVYLTFQVNWPGQSYGVDDVQVDLLPATELAAATRPGAAHGPDPAALLAPPTEPPLFRQFDKNHDGRITRDEMNPQSMNLFNLLDADHDGVVTLKEASDGTKALFGSRNNRRPGQR